MNDLNKMHTVGTHLICNGERGVIIRQYEPARGQSLGMYEVRVPGGVTCVGGGDLRIENPAMFDGNDAKVQTPSYSAGYLYGLYGFTTVEESDWNEEFHNGRYDGAIAYTRASNVSKLNQGI